MASAIDGLISGLKTTDLINSLMQVEAAPQTMLKAKVTKTETLVSALQALNSKVASMRTSAATAAKDSSWLAVKATSSDTSVTAKAAAGAAVSSLSFTVGAVASRQTSVSPAVTSLADVFGGAVPASATIVTGSGADAKVTNLDLTGVTDLAGLASKINASGSGVGATVVKVSDTQSRLQLTGTTTGAVGKFDLYQGTVTAGDITGPTPPTATIARADAITQAQDAQITLWPGTTAAQVVTSSTNTLSGVVSGLDVTVSAVTAPAGAATTVTVGRDDTALKALASDLVANVTTVLSEITSRTRTTTTKADDGRDLISGGVLSADSAVRNLADAVLRAASGPVDGISPSSIGIVIGKDGTITYDEALFTTALTADPAKVQKVVTAVAERLEAVGKEQSDSADGILSLKIKGQQSYRDALNDQVDNFDVRLALRRAALEKTYASLEVSLSNLNAQSSWLTSQLAQLSTNSSSN